MTAQHRITFTHFQYFLSARVGHADYHVDLKITVPAANNRLARFQRFSGGINTAKKYQNPPHHAIALPKSYGGGLEFRPQECINRPA